MGISGGGVQGSDLGKGIQRSGGEVPGRGIRGRGSRDQRVQGSDLEIKGRESRDQGPGIRSSKRSKDQTQGDGPSIRSGSDLGRVSRVQILREGPEIRGRGSRNQI